MLEPRSMEQVLRVLELFRQNKILGFDTEAACTRAIHQVAKEYNVTYQTIGDGCRRRLRLAIVGDFHRLADEWLRGDPSPLISVLKQNSTSSCEHRIDAFFVAPAEADRNSHSQQALRKVPPAKFQLVVANTDARMLQALAQIEGKDDTALGLELLRSAVRDRLRAALS